jgi:hypothetical protein
MASMALTTPVMATRSAGSSPSLSAAGGSCGGWAAGVSLGSFIYLFG